MLSCAGGEPYGDVGKSKRETPEHVWRIDANSAGLCRRGERFKIKMRCLKLKVDVALGSEDC